MYSPKEAGGTRTSSAAPLTRTDTQPTSHQTPYTTQVQGRPGGHQQASDGTRKAAMRLRARHVAVMRRHSMNEIAAVSPSSECRAVFHAEKEHTSRTSATRETVLPVATQYRKLADCAVSRVQHAVRHGDQAMSPAPGSSAALVPQTSLRSPVHVGGKRQRSRVCVGRCPHPHVALLGPRGLGPRPTAQQRRAAPPIAETPYLGEPQERRASRLVRAPRVMNMYRM